MTNEILGHSKGCFYVDKKPSLALPGSAKDGLLKI